jgi:ferritin-like metal-binding protein YciE
MPELNDPKKFFVHKLGAALTMEETVVTMLKELEGKANQTELKEQLSHHREETEGQISNLTQAFSALGKEPERSPCPAIEGLEKEGKETLQMASPELYDTVILAGCAEVEHHEIAAYDGLITMANEMDLDDVVTLLEENLDQEKHTLKEVEKALKKQAKEQAEKIAA